jgi:hypothetical protein
VDRDSVFIVGFLVWLKVCERREFWEGRSVPSEQRYVIADQSFARPVTVKDSAEVFASHLEFARCECMRDSFGLAW